MIQDKHVKHIFSEEALKERERLKEMLSDYRWPKSRTILRYWLEQTKPKGKR